MNTQAYIDLSAQLRSELSTAYPELEIDIYNGQFENPDKFNSYNYPAVFIEFNANNWVNNTDNTQEGLGGFKIHCVSPIVDQDTRNIDLATGPEQTARLAMLAFSQLVHQALQNFQPTGFSTPLERVDDLPDHNYDEKMVVTIHYTAIALDTTTGYYEQDNWETIQLTGTVVTPEIDDSEQEES